MSNQVGFFTAIRYQKEPKTSLQKAQERIGDYFYFGGKHAYVISSDPNSSQHEVVFRKSSQNKAAQFFLCVAKVVSFTTIVIPTIMIILQAIVRGGHQFEVKNPADLVDNAIEQRTNDAAQPLLATAPSKTLLDPNSVEYLMDQFTRAWSSRKKEFSFLDGNFNVTHFTERLNKHTKHFKKPDFDKDQHFGYIEKFDLDPAENPQIYMRADLHGDLKSLIENLRTLQATGLLDKNYKCRPGVHLVFLGDYCDRGFYGTQILELLMSLREENPGQVHLIRGNHEYTLINSTYGGTDSRLLTTLLDPEAKQALESFYETMSLTSYFSVDGEKRDYVQCTHGLFELTTDSAPLLDQGVSGDYLLVPKKRELSQRIQLLAQSSSPLNKTAKRIQDMVQVQWDLPPDSTTYNWGDVTEGKTRLGHPAIREYKVNAKDIRHYLDLSSEQHRVAMLFRGHQHQFQHLTYENAVIVTTLPVGMDCDGYKGRFEQSDRAYIISPQARVANWKKQAILRAPGKTNTDKVTDAYPLTSSDI